MQDDLIGMVVDSVRRRGFLDADPSEAARRRALMGHVVYVSELMGRVCGALYRGEMDCALDEIGHMDRAVRQLFWSAAFVAGMDVGQEGVGRSESDDAQAKIMWQFLKLVEEHGELAAAIRHDWFQGENEQEQRDGVLAELADCLVTVCSVSAQMGLDRSLPGEILGKISRDERRGYLHGAGTNGKNGGA